MKKLIRLTESDLYDMISECVKTTLNEIGDTPYGQFMLGRLSSEKTRNRDIKNNAAAQAEMERGKATAKRKPISTNYFNDGASLQTRFDASWPSMKNNSQKAINRGAKKAWNQTHTPKLTITNRWPKN